jgi:UDP-N-acetylmuramoyl-L-alanyl-D-glutamate--2,6-diaminopimelate ligase
MCQWQEAAMKPIDDARPVRDRGNPGVALSTILPRSRFYACDDIVAATFSDDARRCRRGDVFVARMTSGGDGHDDVARALARGAAGVIAERMVPTAGTPLCLVPDSHWAHARLAHALAGNPAREMRVIAITGTSGKTTTAWLTAAVLAEAGLRVGVLSDLGCLDADSTTPEPDDYSRPAVLADWLRRLALGGCSHAIVEVSSRMLAEQALAGVACDTVAVTNIGEAHLDLHGTAVAYRRVKGRILDALGHGGCLVADGDGDLERLLARAARLDRGLTCLTTGLTAACDLRARSIERSLQGQTFLLSAGGQSLPVSVDAPVTSFARNALTAAAIGLHHGIPLERIVAGIEAAGSVAGRMERLDRGQDVPVFVDSPTSSHALQATLRSLRRLTQGRLAVIADEWVVAMVGHEAFEQAAFRWCDESVVAPATMMDEAEEHPGRADLAAYAAIDRLLSRSGRRDCVLVIGDPSTAGPGRGRPAAAASLPQVVDGWLQLAHPPRPVGRRAA